MRDTYSGDEVRRAVQSESAMRAPTPGAFGADGSKVGWLRSMRRTLGMSLEVFAHRVGLETRSAALKLERKIADESISIRKLRQAAQAVGCRVEIHVIPEQPVEEIARQQARKRAAAKLARVQQSMRLENQAVDDPAFQKILDDLTESYLARGKKTLWSED